MSAQLIELLIFAAIAFFIISKLISTIGTTSEDDPAKKKKIFFGETGIKDVTPEGNTKVKIYRPAFKNKQLDQSLKALIVPEHKEDISKGLSEVMERMPSFNIEKFLRGAKVAFKMILNYGKDNNEAEIEKLVDKRYIDHFTAMIPSYGNYKEGSSKNLTGKISEIYMFGNNIFVKVLFAGKNITDKIKELHEEWTFTKSTLSSSPDWHLTNIDRPQ